MMTIFLSGMLIGVITTWLLVKHVIKELLNDLERLKDFETWKEWKNK
jgi:hypothetical protein